MTTLEKEELPEQTQHQEIVAVNFKENPSLSERYEAFLTQVIWGSFSFKLYIVNGKGLLSK